MLGMKKIKYAHHFPTLKTTITVFQALTLLAEKYQGDLTRSAQIDSLYLSGIRNPADQNQLNILLQDDLFNDYIISCKKFDINNDPVRRYFESQLCYETLINTLDDLESIPLGHLNAEINHLSNKGSHSINIKLNLKRTQNMQQYTNAISALMLQRISPAQVDKSTMIAIDQQAASSRKQKISRLYGCYTGIPGGDMLFVTADKLNLFANEKGIYSSADRGRIARVGSESNNPQIVYSHHLGIMKAFMPIPQHDPLHFQHNTNYVRHADRKTYREGALQVELAFFNQVTPFSNSISGDMLRQLVVIDRLHKQSKFYYANNPKQLKGYFKNYIALSIYLFGCHSLNEFMSVLQLPEVQYTFRTISTFSDLTLDTLFKDENRPAFHHALFKTIEYNERIISRKKLHQHFTYVTEQHPQRMLKETLIVNHNITRSDISDCNLQLLLTPTHFLNAVKLGLNQQIEFAIQQGLNVNLMNGNKWTLLDYALHYQQWIAAVLLMKAGATAKHKHAFVKNKLCIYLYKYDIENINLILASQDQLKAYFHDDKVIQCIHRLVKYDKTELIKRVLGAGFAINQRAQHNAQATLRFLITNHEMISDRPSLDAINRPSLIKSSFFKRSHDKDNTIDEQTAVVQQKPFT